MKDSNDKKTVSVFNVLGAMSCAGMMSLSPLTPSLAADQDQDQEHVSPSLETITVTAQRREESLQSVPIAINTISGEDAALRGTSSIQTVSASVPNLTMTVSGSTTNTYIRGVGTVSASMNNEPSAATYVDGVYMPSSFALSGFAFNKIERLEVLKGPQGTLFGRNTTAGVIQVVTPDPSHELGGEVSLGYGKYDTTSASGYLTGGISENLSADVAVLHQEQGDGFGHNLTYGTENFIYENAAARSKWLYTPSDATRIHVALDYSEYHTDGTNNQIAPGAINPLNQGTYPGRYNSVGDVWLTRSKQYGASLKIEQELGPLQGVSISSYRDVTSRILFDNDLTPAHLTRIDGGGESDYVSQEFHLSSRDPGRINWLVGAFYFGNQVDGFYPAKFTGSQVSPGQYRESYGSQKSQSASVFGQATAALFADTNLTLGLRYTDETLKFNGFQINSAGQVFQGPLTSELSFEPLTWRVALDHQFTQDVLGYVSYNRGFKSGGYNLLAVSSPPFDRETIDAYEMGVKSEIMDGRIRLNAAVFYYDYQDLQVQVVFGGGTTIFTNAAAARNYGADIDLQFAATNNLTISAGLGLLDAKYEDYPNAVGFSDRGVQILLPNAKGQSLPYAPPVSATVSIDYRLDTNFGDFRSTASATYNDRSFVAPDEGFERPSYTLLNASIEWRSGSHDSFGIRLWGKNLSDATYLNFATESNRSYIQSEAAPRTYGLTLMKEF